MFVSLSNSAVRKKNRNKQSTFAFAELFALHANVIIVSLLLKKEKNHYEI